MGEHFAVDWLAEASVDHANAQTVGAELIGGQQGVLRKCPVGHERGVTPLAQYPALADGPFLARGEAERFVDDLIEIGRGNIIARFCSISSDRVVS